MAEKSDRADDSQDLDQQPTEDLRETLPCVYPTDQPEVPVDFFSAAAPACESNQSRQSSGVDRLPCDFGDYELLDQLGVGGMGIVYRALQRSADRIVALKMIRPDVLRHLPLSHQRPVIERFQTEAHAAAKLDHEHLVTVYEVGEINGQHFFSMRFVAGRSLAKILQDGPLNEARAARLLAPVARAVAAAHEHNVLHRDLKPHNILIDDQAERAFVADFGLAKLINDESELTLSGQTMGTPPYMSPEQTRDASSAGHLSDIYGLGATLYHALTGRPPFQAASTIETLRQVVEDDPVSPRQLNPGISRDVETICLKCLEKEPARRYASATALADELQRVLIGEPIQARPISSAGRLLRWCRRKPLLATLSGGLVAMLMLALTATTWGYVTQSAAREESERSFRFTLGAVNDLFRTVAEDRLLNQPGAQPLRHDLLTRALHYYEELLAERANDPTLRSEIAMTNYRVGRILEETASVKLALDRYATARLMLSQLVGDESSNLQHRQDLGTVYTAEATGLTKLGRFEQALHMHVEALQLRQTISESDPAAIESQRMLANSLMNIGLVRQLMGDFEAARDAMTNAQAIRSKALRLAGNDRSLRRDLAIGHYNLSRLGFAAGNDDEAKQSSLAAIDALKLILQPVDTDLEAEYLLAISYRMLGDAEDDADAAFSSYTESGALMHRLARENPAVVKFHGEAAGVDIQLGELAYDDRNLSDALVSLQTAERTLRKLSDRSAPIPARYREFLATTWLELGRIHVDQRKWRESRAYLQKSISEFRSLSNFANREAIEARILVAEQLMELLPPSDN